jgi:hypothetical protein
MFLSIHNNACVTPRQNFSIGFIAFFNFFPLQYQTDPLYQILFVSLTQTVSARVVSKNFHTQTFHSILFWTNCIHPHTLYCISLDTFDIILIIYDYSSRIML